MEESRGLKTRRNYRRRHCSHGGDSEEEDEEDDDDEKDEKDEKNFGLNFESRAGEDGNLKQPSASSVIPVDEAVGAYDSALGSVDGGSLSAPPPSPPREASGAQGVGSGRNGARIASGIGFHMLRAMGWVRCRPSFNSIYRGHLSFVRENVGIAAQGRSRSESLRQNTIGIPFLDRIGGQFNLSLDFEARISS